MLPNSHSPKKSVVPTEARIAANSSSAIAIPTKIAAAFARSTISETSVLASAICVVTSRRTASIVRRSWASSPADGGASDAGACGGAGVASIAGWPGGSVGSPPSPPGVFWLRSHLRHAGRVPR
jgi:hypothetical protein